MFFFRNMFCFVIIFPEGGHKLCVCKMTSLKIDSADKHRWICVRLYLKMFSYELSTSKNTFTHFYNILV